jgi:hypothetical protein
VLLIEISFEMDGPCRHEATRLKQLRPWHFDEASVPNKGHVSAHTTNNLCGRIEQQRKLAVIE